MPGDREGRPEKSEWDNQENQCQETAPYGRIDFIRVLCKLLGELRGDQEGNPGIQNAQHQHCGERDIHEVAATVPNEAGRTCDGFENR